MPNSQSISVSLMKTSSAARLLVRPTMVPGECELGYMDRVALANGLAGFSLQLDEKHLRTLVKPTGAPLDWSRVDASQRRDTLEFEGPLRRVPPWAQRMGVFRCPPVCLSCLAQARFIRAAWRLKGFDICPEHKKPLVEVLGPGGRLASTRQLLLGQGISYRDSYVQRASSTELSELEFELIERIWAPVMSPAASDADWAAGVFCVRLLSMVTTMASCRAKPLPSRRVFARAGGWLEPGMLGIEAGAAFMGHLVSVIAGTGQRNVQQHFLSHTLEAENYAPSILSVLPLAKWNELASHHQLSPVSTSGKPGVPIGLQDFVKRTGAAPSQIHNALKARKSSMSKVFLGSRVQSTLNSKEAQDLVGEVRAGLPRRKAVSALGLCGNRESLRRLRRAQVASFQYGWSGPYLREPIQQLLSDLDNVALPCPPQGGLAIRLSDPRLIGRWNSGAIRELFDCLKAGVLPVWRAGQGGGLSGYCVPLDLLQRMQRRSRDLRRLMECPQQLRLFGAGSA